MPDTHSTLPPAATTILSALRAAVEGAAVQPIDLLSLPPADLAFIDDLLGEGEVKAALGTEMEAWESVFAGVWRVRRRDGDGNLVADHVECGPFPEDLLDRGFADARTRTVTPESEGLHVLNARPLLAEIDDRVRSGGDNHVINLTLLPHTPDDLAYLDAALGRGTLFIRTRGYGPCEMWAAGTRNCWWVRHFDSRDKVMLEGIEIGRLPEAAPAAPEDLADSADRMAEVLEAYR